jgi:hypothetical protein
MGSRGLQESREGARESRERDREGGVECFVVGFTMATPKREADYARYTLLRQTIPYLSPAAGDKDEDIRERTRLELAHPDFSARYEMETAHTSKPKLPLVPFGGKRKRSRKTKRRYRRNAAQSHRRI